MSKRYYTVVLLKVDADLVEEVITKLSILFKANTVLEGMPGYVDFDNYIFRDTPIIRIERVLDCFYWRLGYTVEAFAFGICSIGVDARELVLQCCNDTVVLLEECTEWTNQKLAVYSENGLKESVLEDSVDEAFDHESWLEDNLGYVLTKLYEV